MAAELRQSLMLIALARADRDKNNAAEKDPRKHVTDDEFRKAVESLLVAGAGGVSPEVRERVMRRCFSVTKRRSGTGWADLLNQQGGLMFEDVNLSASIEIMYHVFEHNGLLDFFVARPSTTEDRPA